MAKLRAYFRSLFSDGHWIYTVLLFVVLAVFALPYLARVGTFVRSKVPGLPGASAQ